MRGITRWVLIFDAERFSQKKCAHRRALLTAFLISVLGGAEPTEPGTQRPVRNMLARGCTRFLRAPELNLRLALT